MVGDILQIWSAFVGTVTMSVALFIAWRGGHLAGRIERTLDYLGKSEEDHESRLRQLERGSDG